MTIIDVSLSSGARISCARAATLWPRCRARTRIIPTSPTAPPSETDRAIELRARDRQRKLISKIESALGRLDDGSYGYCEETGEPISLKRLDARPIATLSVEAQERHERRERVYRDG